MKIVFNSMLFNLFLFLPLPAWSSEFDINRLNLTSETAGYIALFIFFLAYTLVIFEEKLHLQKSKPVLIAAGLIWALIAFAYQSQGLTDQVSNALRHNFLEYSELFFFLLVAMTYISAMIERGVFDALHYRLVSRGFSYKQLFWITGLLAFFISPIADNLTTALIMCTVVLTVGPQSRNSLALPVSILL